MSEPLFSIEDLSRLKTIDRAIAHAEAKGTKLTNSLSSKQIRFLRGLVERLSSPELRAVLASSPSSGWQPIETGPTKTLVLVDGDRRQPG